MRWLGGVIKRGKVKFRRAVFAEESVILCASRGEWEREWELNAAGIKLYVSSEW